MDNAEEKARILVTEIADALARGTQHYNKAGRLLTMPKEIIETMLTEGGVQFQPAHDWQFYMNGTFCSRCGLPIGTQSPCL